MPVSEPTIKALTEAEKEVLFLITEQNLNLKQIQIRRQCSRQAVYKVVKSLKNKGALGFGLHKVDNLQASCQPTNQVRLHGQEFNIKILWQDEKFQTTLRNANILYTNGHTIKLYRNSIEVYAGEGLSFYGKNERDADTKASKYWFKFFTKLENDLKVILIKNRSHNIKEVNHHYARGNSEVCENALEQEGKKIRIFCPIDNKLAFITDESFGDKEDETLHPITAKPDRAAIDKQINDWRLHNPPTNSQLAAHVMQVSQNLQDYAVHLKAHVESVKQLGDAVGELTSIIKELKK